MAILSKAGYVCRVLLVIGRILVGHLNHSSDLTVSMPTSQTIHQGGLESVRLQASENGKHYERFSKPLSAKAHQHLSIEDGLIVHGCRPLIPQEMQQTILHEAHQESTLRAHLTVYWPGMDHEIDTVILACKQPPVSAKGTLNCNPHILFKKLQLTFVIMLEGSIS